MIKHKNSVEHNPPHSYGDCHRACFATILGLPMEDVPHFYEHPDNDGEMLIREFLAGYNLVHGHVIYDGVTPLEDMLLIIKGMYPGVAAILGGTSSRGCGHSVVVFEGEIYNDPTGSGLVGPMSDGYWWLTFFIVKPDYLKVS